MRVEGANLRVVVRSADLAPSSDGVWGSRGLSEGRILSLIPRLRGPDLGHAISADLHLPSALAMGKLQSPLILRWI